MMPLLTSSGKPRTMASCRQLLLISAHLLQTQAFLLNFPLSLRTPALIFFFSSYYSSAAQWMSFEASWTLAPNPVGSATTCLGIPLGRGRKLWGSPALRRCTISVLTPQAFQTCACPFCSLEHTPVLGEQRLPEQMVEAGRASCPASALRLVTRSFHFKSPALGMESGTD